MKNRGILFALAGTYILSLCSCGTSGNQDNRQVLDMGKKTTEEATEASTTAGTEEILSEADEATIIRRAKYADAVARFYYAGEWPDGTILEGFNWDEMHENQYAICDIDSDGIEELILSDTQTSVAGMMEGIFQYDIETGQMRQEFLEYPAVTYLSNGYVEVLWAHNQGVTTDMWPFSVHRYDAQTDTYEYIASVDSWNKEEFPEDYDGTPFPDEYDADGDGNIYYVRPNGGERQPMDNAEFEAWRTGIEQGAAPINVTYRTDNDDTLKSYTDAYKKLCYQKYTQVYGDAVGDLGLRFLQADAIDVQDFKEELENRYGLSFTVEDEYGDREVGSLDGQSPIILDYMNATSLTYQETPVEDLTIFGIYPGVSEETALERLQTAGFYASELEDGYITGDMWGHVCVWLDVEDGIVKAISIRTYCSYAG